RAHHEPAGTLLGAGAPRGVVAGGFPHLVRDALAAAPPGGDAVPDAADRGVEAQQGVQPQPLEPWRVAVRVGVLQLVDGGGVDVLSPGVGGEHLDPLVEGLLEPGRGSACPAREVSAVQAFDDGSDELDQQVPPDGEVGPAVEVRGFVVASSGAHHGGGVEDGAADLGEVAALGHHQCVQQLTLTDLQEAVVAHGGGEPVITSGGHGGSSNDRGSRTTSRSGWLTAPGPRASGACDQDRPLRAAGGPAAPSLLGGYVLAGPHQPLRRGFEFENPLLKLAEKPVAFPDLPQLLGGVADSGVGAGVDRLL